MPGSGDAIGLSLAKPLALSRTSVTVEETLVPYPQWHRLTTASAFKREG